MGFGHDWLVLEDRAESAERLVEQLAAALKDARECEGLKTWWDGTEHMDTIDRALDAYRGWRPPDEP